MIVVLFYFGFTLNFFVAIWLKLKPGVAASFNVKLSLSWGSTIFLVKLLILFEFFEAHGSIFVASLSLSSL